ncbi:MAG: hypothetical protein ABSF32_11195 [Ignavibacteria bacterium]|jgi:hypothetical protein
MKIKTKKNKKQRTYKSSKNIEYITDPNGKKRKVILPIKTYESLLEDLHDLAIVADRKNDKVIPYDDVIKDLKKDELL